jgi:hypothetical protein
MLGEDLSGYETIRCRTIKFAPQIAAELKRRWPPASPRRHLMRWSATSLFVECIFGARSMMRAKSGLGHAAVPSHHTAAKFTIDQPTWPESITTDGWRAYRPVEAPQDSKGSLHERGQGNQRADNSHLPIPDENGRCKGWNRGLPSSATSKLTPPSTTSFIPSSISSAA